MADAAPPAPAASEPAPAPASAARRTRTRTGRAASQDPKKAKPAKAPEPLTDASVKAATASAIKEDSALREAAQTGTLTLKMVRKTVVRRMALGDDERRDAQKAIQGPDEDRDAPGRDGAPGRRQAPQGGACRKLRRPRRPPAET